MTAQKALGVRSNASAYADVVEAASMRNIRLIKSEFTVDPESLGSDQRTWKRGFACVVASTNFNETRQMGSGLISAEAYCKAGRKKIVSLKCNYVVAYDIEGAPSADDVARFIERVGNFAAYPYFRAHFADVTAQAGINLPPLPVMKEGKRRLNPTE